MNASQFRRDSRRDGNKFMTAHIVAAELVRKMPELVKDSNLNQMLTIEAMLIEFQDRIVEQTVAAAFNSVGIKAGCEVAS